MTIINDKNRNYFWTDSSYHAGWYLILRVLITGRACLSNISEHATVSKLLTFSNSRHSMSCIRTFRSFENSSWLMSWYLRKVYMTLSADGFGMSRTQLIMKWSLGNCSLSMVYFLTNCSSCLVMTRSKVWPHLCVGPMICCTNPFDANLVEKRRTSDLLACSHTQLQGLGICTFSWHMHWTGSPPLEQSVLLWLLFSSFLSKLWYLDVDGWLFLLFEEGTPFFIHHIFPVIGFL